MIKIHHDTFVYMIYFALIFISHVAYNWCFQIDLVISHRDQVATTNHVR